MRNERAIAWGITAVALAVRLYLSTTFYLNPDEAIHLVAAAKQAWAAVHHPPLLLFWLWLASVFSDQEWWLRLVPSVAGGLTPLVTGLWLRRFTSPVTAWGLATLVAASPTLVLLSIQLRGYSMAMLGAVAALYALDRAMEERSIRWMILHFLALTVAVLSEFSAAWVTLAAGLYGLARFWQEPETRKLLAAWVGGQSCVAALYAALYFLVVKALVREYSIIQVVGGYLGDSFLHEGQSLPGFVAVGSAAQFKYFLGGSPAGWLGMLAAGVGLWSWWRRGDKRWVLATGVHLAAAGAIWQFYPYGRSRHTVLIGLVSMAATAEGLDALGRWWKQIPFAVIGCILLLHFVRPAYHSSFVTLDSWDKARWERAMEQVERSIPKGGTVLIDGESLYMMQGRHFARSERRIHPPPWKPMQVREWTMIPGEFDWKPTAAARIRLATERVSGPVWLLDMGFVSDSVRGRREELGLTTVVDEPGVLYLGRLR